MKHDSFSSSDGHTNKSNNCGTVNKSQVSRALRVLKPWNRAVPHAVLCLISPTPNRSGSSLNMGPPKQLKRTFLGFDLSTQKVRTGTAYVVSLHLRCGGVSKSTTSGPIACEWCYWKRSNGTRELETRTTLISCGDRGSFLAYLLKTRAPTDLTIMV